MRWLGTLLASLVVTLVTYFWAIPYFGAWFGLSFLPPDKQSAFTGAMLTLAIGSCFVVTLLRRPTVIFTVMGGGAAIGGMSLMSLAVKTSGQALPPALLKGGVIIGAGIGFCLSLGAAILSLVIVLLVEQWLVPRLSESREKTLTPDPLMSSPPLQSPSPKPKKRPKQTRQISPAFTWAMVLIAGIILIPVSKKIEWPLFGTPSLDPQFKLTPSVWEGAITYKDTDYAFTLVFEEVEQRGNLLGYMDWPAQGGGPHARLVVEGTATGNHLEFEDTEFIIGDNTLGVFDKKDVWISGKRMTGTDKNGTATLKAHRTSLSPPVASAMTAIGFRARKKTFEASWGKHIRVCQDIERAAQGLNVGKRGETLASTCWKELAKEAKELTFCWKATAPRDQSPCFIDVAWETGDWEGCPDLGSAMPIQGCVDAAATISGDAQVCKWYMNPDNTNLQGYAICQAVAKRDPEGCAKVPTEGAWHNQDTCWRQLAIALKEPKWCEYLSTRSFETRTACYDLVKNRLHMETHQYTYYDRCESLRTPVEQDACYLKLIARGAPSTTCIRIQTETLKGTCAAIQSL